MPIWDRAEPIAPPFANVPKSWAMLPALSIILPAKEEPRCLPEFLLRIELHALNFMQVFDFSQMSFSAVGKVRDAAEYKKALGMAESQK